MREFIRRLASEGLSLFVSSHLLSEIQQMCDRVAIISHGEVIAVGEVDELLQQSGSTIVWHVEPYERAREILASDPSVQVLDSARLDPELDGEDSVGGRKLTVRMEQERIPEWNEKLVAARVRVYSIGIHHPTLEELFLRLTEGENIE
jgi:ABC-2 type transport system ATP-binding protein